MRTKKILQFTMLLLCMSFSSIGRDLFAPQDGEPDQCGCKTTQINISTGYHRPTGTVLSPGSFDPMWVVTTVPTSSGLSTPMIPYVIAPASVWGSSTPALQTALNSNAGWLSPFNTAGYMVNNPPPDAPFVFKLDFCVCEAGTYRFQGSMCADDEGELWLDGTTLLCSVPNWHSVITYNVTSPLAAGSHYLELKLRNTGAQVMGIGMEGNITNTNGTSSLIGFDCCSPKAGVNGRKYLDTDCDGQITDADAIGVGWQFTLNPGGYTATSDILGYFNFTNIPPGTYTLSEVMQPGYHAVTPSGGTTTITLAAGDVKTVDFLNSNCSVNCDLECYWRVTGNNTLSAASNYLGTNNTAPVIIKTNTIQRAVIEGTGDGNMGIATPTPSTILHVYSAPPPAGAPSGLRFEDLPTGKGQILVVDNNGYVYRVDDGQFRTGNSSIDAMQMQNQMKEMRQEIDELKAMLGGSDGNSLSVSPNPTTGQARATYHIANAYSNAIIRVIDKSGRTVVSTVVSGNDGTVSLNIPGTVVSGDLICTLLVDGKATTSQKLVLNKN